jgi:hypothetical protein
MNEELVLDDMSFIPDDNNTNLTEIDINLINDNTFEQFGDTNETVSAPSCTTKHIPKRRRTDPVWDFIDEIDNKRCCKLCHKEYSKETGITTIKGHFKRDHPEFLQTNPIEPYGKKDEDKVMFLIELLVRWIITDQRAFSVVENADFCAFIAALDQRFKLPTRQAISESILDLYSYQKEMVHTLLTTMTNKFAITTDIWSSCTNLGYLAVTLHWINEDWTTSKILLDMVPLHERHTGSYIAEKIFETINYYDIGARILAVTTDNASSMIVFGNMLNEMLQLKYGNTNFEQVRYAAHVLNLAVSDGMRVVANSITKLRNFTSYIH